MTQHGFYSIVRNRFDETGNTWLVRGRRRQDLRNLVKKCGLDLEIHESDSADYQFRIVVTESDLKAIRDSLFKAVDYTNFKIRLAESPDQSDKLDAYHSVWATMAQLQRWPGPH